MTDGAQTLGAMFAEARAEGRAVLMPYLTAGIPTVESSVDLFVAMAEAGADAFEVGIPYADPLMDGPVIMRAGEIALSRGVTVDVAFDVIAAVVAATGRPVLAMTYVNPVLHRGIDAFMATLAAAGASGIILADLPVDESAPFVEAAERHGIGMVQFVAPTTNAARLAAVAASRPAFVYAIAEVGVTGERSEASANTEILATAIREATGAPIVFGVGISTPNQAGAAAVHGDGVIVGTAIVRRVLDADTPQAAAADLAVAIGELARAVRRR